MNIITLTTDYGTDSHYVAQVKGAIYQVAGAGVSVVDISNRIASFDINDAAFAVKNSYAFFPAGTIHLIGVNNQADAHTRQLLCIADGHYFIAADIGVLPLIFEQGGQAVYYTLGNGAEGHTFITRDFYPMVVDKLIKTSFDMEGAGYHKISDPVMRLSEKPIVRDNFLRATVVYIDSFGNAYLNLNKAYFDEFVGNHKFVFKILREEFQGVIHKDYSDTEAGEVVFMFKSPDYLQIALNKGRADQYLGLKKNTNILIEKI